MKKIYVDYIGFWRDFDKENNFISDILNKKCEVVISKDPEYVFVSSFYEPFEYANYDCVRVFYTAEADSPDFSSFDYCIGCDHIKAGDRYLRYPYYALRWSEKLSKQGKYHELCRNEAVTLLKEKEHFCNLVCGHDTDTQLRERVFRKLSEYKKVDAVGTFLNNQKDGFRVHYGAEKDDYQRKSKFSIAIEPIIYPGYITEKIMESLYVHSVPLYFGDPTISDFFNPKSFVLIQDEGDLNALLERVIELDQDDEKYIEMLMQNPFNEANHIERLNELLEQFLFHIVLQDHEKAYRRVREYIPLSHNNCLKNYKVMQKELQEIKKHKWYWIMKKLSR